MTDSKAIGELVEDVVVETVDGIDPVDEGDGYWHDATVVGPIEATANVATVGLCLDDVGDGTPIEIKGARYRISNGSDDRDGRFYVRQKQHGKIVDAGGVYLLAVYRPEQARDGGFDLRLAGLVFASADVVEERRNSWYDLDRRETYTQVRWSDFPFNGDLASETTR
ncbi:MAG: hypothetical protein SV760_00770, partial [Halobacteria archaeon]|nr:hypothetical protein [Halobacteria archaeon]